MDIGINKSEQNRYHAILDAKWWELRERFPVISVACETVP